MNTNQEGSSRQSAEDAECKSPDVTVWFRALGAGDENAAERLWEYCMPRLLSYSRTRLPPKLRKALDEEDVALSAFKSLCAGARAGNLQSVQNRKELWSLLTCITARKTSGYIKHETRQKRGGGQVRGESIFQLADSSHRQGTESGGIENHTPIIGRASDSPDVIAEFADTCETMLDALEDDMLRTIAVLRLEGYSVEEIAQRVGCAKRSVERRLALIRRIWSDEPNDTDTTTSE